MIVSFKNENWKKKELGLERLIEWLELQYSGDTRIIQWLIYLRLPWILWAAIPFLPVSEQVVVIDKNPFEI